MRAWTASDVAGSHRRGMEPAGLEPATFWMQTRRSPN
jgi:hypothetical protein